MRTQQANQQNVRSAAVQATWGNKKVAAARAMHNHVVVNGVEYRSVRQAFAELGLPDSKHIAFRMMLKAKGKVAFDYNGKRYNFKLVK